MDSRLPVVEANGIATRPLEVVENAGQPRRRVYLAADAVGVYTSAVSAANYPTNWIRSVYGQPPAWLSAADRQQWHAERDPNRKRLALSLISTDDVSAWCAMLTNRIESAAPTNVSFLQIYSNDIALACGSASPSIEVLVHAPSSVPSLGLYQSTNLLAQLGWRPIATLAHATDPIRWLWNMVTG
jgi:hypothetical protein